MANNLSDNELIKTLEVISDTSNCHECGFYDGKIHNCAQIVAQASLGLIKHLKAENERLQKENEGYTELEQGCYVTGYKNIRAETIKEFAERLKEELVITQFECGDYLYDVYDVDETLDIIDKIKIEMVGEDIV